MARRTGETGKSLRARFARFWFRPPKEIAWSLLPWFVIGMGLSLAVLSAYPQVRTVNTFRFAGSADPSVVTTVWFPEAAYGSASVGFETRPSCSLRLYLLNDAETEAFNASGALPPPLTALTCDRIEGVYQGKIRALAFENVGTVTLPYAVQTTLFVAAFPYAPLVLPGALLAIAGVIPLLARMVIGGIEKIVEEYSRDRTLNDRDEEKSDKKR